jgi:hypothetical protein
MISKEGFCSLIETASAMYNMHCTILEVLGIDDNGNGAITSHIDKLLTTAANEMGDCDKTELIERLGDDFDMSDAAYWSADMPLVIHFAWNLNFGDGGLYGEITTIKLEGQDYELNTAADLYECLSHFNQLRAHYGVE